MSLGHPAWRAPSNGNTASPLDGHRYADLKAYIALIEMTLADPAEAFRAAETLVGELLACGVLGLEALADRTLIITIKDIRATASTPASAQAALREWQRAASDRLAPGLRK